MLSSKIVVSNNRVKHQLIMKQHNHTKYSVILPTYVLIKGARTSNFTNTTLEPSDTKSIHVLERAPYCSNKWT